MAAEGAQEKGHLFTVSATWSGDAQGCGILHLPEGDLSIPVGGSKKLNMNSELYIPVPGSGNDKSLRVFAFADAGNVWSERENIDFATLRASAGLGLSWTSPVGPFKLSWGVPLRAKPGDRIQRFQFQVGTGF